jgi:UrcA family protein
VLSSASIDDLEADMKFTGKFLGGAAILSFACAIAYADSPSTVGFQHAATVRFADLNLDRARDVAALYGRIELAADKLCGPKSLTGHYYKAADYESCTSDAISDAVARIDRESLTAYYRQHAAAPVTRQVSIAKQ